MRVCGSRLLTCDPNTTIRCVERRGIIPQPKGLLKRPVFLPKQRHLTPDTVPKSPPPHTHTHHLMCHTLPARLLALSPVQQRQELISSLRPLPHRAQHTARSCDSSRLLYTAHNHAHMRTLHNHRYTLWLEHLAQSKRDLLRKTLLHLQTPAEHLCYSCELREADHPSRGNVANVHLRKVVSTAHSAGLGIQSKAYLARERHQMMLAQTVDIDVLHDNQLIVILVEYRIVHNIP